MKTNLIKRMGLKSSLKTVKCKYNIDNCIGVWEASRDALNSSVGAGFPALLKVCKFHTIQDAYMWPSWLDHRVGGAASPSPPDVPPLPFPSPSGSIQIFPLALWPIVSLKLCLCLVVGWVRKEFLQHFSEQAKEKKNKQKICKLILRAITLPWPFSKNARVLPLHFGELLFSN